MSLTSGFFNSLNGDRVYNAEQFSSLFDGLITDGVFVTCGQAFDVTPGTGLSVNVGTGRAWFNHTWTYNDTLLNVECSAPDILLHRIDSIVLEVNTSTRENTIRFVQGVAASNPVPPTLINNDNVHQYPLCYIDRRPNSNDILTTDIEMRVGRAECPIVSGIVETIDPNIFFANWQQALENELLAIKSRSDVMLLSVYDQNHNGIVDNAEHSSDSDHAIDSEYYYSVFPVAGWTEYSQNPTVWRQEVACSGLSSGDNLDSPRTEVTLQITTNRNLQLGLQAMCSSNGHAYQAGNNQLIWYTTQKPSIDMPIYIRKSSFHST